MLSPAIGKVVYYGELPFGTEARLSNPLVIRIVRPYDSEDAYLEAESWSIDTKTMLLIGQRKVPPDTAILFDVALANGRKVIKAEARVVGFVAANGGRPSGLRVQFKRFGTATKAFIDRAVSINERARDEGDEPPPSEVHHFPPPPPAEAAPPLQAEQPRAPEPVVAAVSVAQAPVAVPPEAAAPVVQLAERSGVHRRVVAPVPPPPNREELLEKLRARNRSLKNLPNTAAASEETA